VDNILWGGASFEIREIFVGFDKITDFYSTIYYPVTGGKKFLGENFKEFSHFDITFKNSF